MDVKIEDGKVVVADPANVTADGVPEIPGVDTDLPSVESNADPLWYLKFEGATAEALNETFGIKQIVVYDKMSPAQRGKNIIAKVTMRTIACTVTGITVFCNRLPEPIDGHEFRLSIANPSRYVDGAEGQKGKYQSDTFLTSAARAQILTHIQSRLRTTK